MVLKQRFSISLLGWMVQVHEFFRILFLGTTGSTSSQPSALHARICGIQIFRCADLGGCLGASDLGSCARADVCFGCAASCPDSTVSEPISPGLEAGSRRPGVRAEGLEELWLSTVLPRAGQLAQQLCTIASRQELAGPGGNPAQKPSPVAFHGTLHAAA